VLGRTIIRELDDPRRSTASGLDLDVSVFVRHGGFFVWVADPIEVIRIRISNMNCCELAVAKVGVQEGGWWEEGEGGAVNCGNFGC